MEKEQLREGLKRLHDYVQKLDFHSRFLEEDSMVPMDSLAIPLQVGEELSVDISCNFVEMEDVGNILQFYGQIVVNEMLKEAEASVSDVDILDLLNALNRLIPIGQFLYLFDRADEEREKVIGMRYTMLTELDSAAELKKCGNVLLLLMQIYDLLCSALLLVLDGNSVEETLRTMEELLV